MTAVSGVSDEGGGELILSSLLKYTRYAVVVQAFNQVGQGPLSEPVTAQTMEDGRCNSYKIINHICSKSAVQKWAPKMFRPYSSQICSGNVH